MKLAELQANFQEAILTGERAISASILPSCRLDAAARFEIYADAYRLRLAGFLSNDYPVLRNALGDEDFGALVEAYMERVPSQHRNARWYGHHLPDFMQQNDPWRESRQAVDLARFEKALADAFDAADAEILDLNCIAGVPPDDWPSLRFVLHPSVILLRLVQGIFETYAAALEEEATAPLFPLGKDAEKAISCEEAVLVWRKEGQSYYRLLGDDEVLALNEARFGKTFGEICSLLAFKNSGDDVTELAATFLATWFRDGLVSSLTR
jgi:hypothetical protein